MVETDWREILSFSQRELMQSDKEKLCESLSWMEADDIELNFSDLKTLFRLAQDILKFKSEQVNNLLGQLETTQRKGGKGKSKSSFMESPTKSSDSVLETIAHQEEVIKANKEILEQLYADIAELEGRKKNLEEYRDDEDKESESSLDVLSEMNAMAQLENEVTMKNRHIRKLLGDVKILEEENTKLKEKVSVLKDKLTEATELIENLTEQLFKMNSESNRLKETLGKCEQAKAKLSLEIELMKKEVSENVAVKENIHEEIKSKVQHWKNIARSKKAEIEALSSENIRLKENLIHASRSLPSSPKVKINKAEELKIKELQEKLSEATNQILESANIINLLKAENKQLKATLEDTHDFSISDTKNESDDGKERAMIIKLKAKVKRLGIALQGAEEMVAIREKELSEIASQLQLLKSDEGINALLENLKSKKRKLKFKDGGIKSLVQEVNTLSQLLDDLQLENEAMRLQLNITADQKIPTKGIIRKHRESEQYNVQLIKELRKFKNKLVAVELNNRNLNNIIKKLTKRLTDMGCSQEEIDDICRTVDDDDDVMPLNGGGEASTIPEKQKRQESKEISESEKEMQTIIEENEGLRKGLQEILNFLKDNSTTSSGVLAVQCPSLEAILNSMEARHAAGWFAPHMAAVMELKAALGGKDALLTALHEARKETFNIMNKLTKETEKSQELEQKLQDIESKNKEPSEEKLYEPPTNIFSGEFGTWMSDKEQNITDFFDRSKIENMLKNGNLIYEDQLKNGLIYFHGRFKALYEKMTAIAIQTTDDQNKWIIQEEKYRAEIENLKALVSQNDDDPGSDISPGLVSLPTIDSLQRKCSYLEESYKYIRTLHENMKNEYLETKREAMIMAADYETEIQKLMLSIANLTDKLRCCVSVELFWKQNESFNEMSTKYRKLVEGDVKQKTEPIDLLKRLEDDKIDIINSIRRVITESETKENDKLKTMMSNIEQAIFSKQLQQVCLEFEEKNKKIEKLEGKIFELQEAQSKLIDETLASSTKEDVNLMKDQLENLAEENKILKEQCQHVESQLDIALLQLQDSQQRQMSNDLEINMLRHQILDLQSVGDNKAIVARLSGEVLVAHIQASENHKKLERLTASLNKERQQKLEVEEMLKARQKIFEVYAFRYEAKFRYMFEVMHVLRQQYQGSLPLFSLENYLNHIEEFSRKTYEVDEKLDEIEDLQSTLMMKHSVFDQVLDVSKNKCLQDEDSCQHKLQYIVLQGVHSRELDHCKKKMETLELSRKEILKRCYNLEKTLILTNQGFEKPLNDMVERRNSLEKDVDRQLEIEDIQSDDDTDSRKSRTITLPKPLILKPAKSNIEKTKVSKDDNADVLMGSPVKASKYNDIPEVVNVFVQTSTLESKKINKWVQTDEDKEVNEFKNYIRHLEIHIDGVNKELKQIMLDTQQKSEEIMNLNDDKIHLEGKIQNLNRFLSQRDKEIENLHESLKQLKQRFDDHKYAERIRISEVAKEDNNTLINALKRLETDKNTIVAEYTELLNKEREEYAKSVKDLQSKVLELQTKLDSKPSDPVNAATLKESISKYTLKIAELEDKCFKSQNELDGCKAELMTYQSEVDRWKDLASERLTKMEQLNSQLEERHCHEVESYKQENEHWLSQLNETQREHMELRSRLTEQKASYVKQLADKDAHIEQLRSMVHGLKTQIVSMQTMISITDPSFDLSAIVEVEEGSDALSQHGSERLELKYDSSIDLHDTHEDYRMSSSSAIWQEPLIERLRREKQLTAKQNAMLRRQIKALAARERRARLDAQNLKNQVFRISTSGGKVATAETAALHNKIASLQAQLMTARRDTHSTVALWDKWKRAQQAAERWQARYEEKCQDVKKLEASVALAKSAVTRLEKEKRVLLIRLTEVKNEKVLVVEKQDSERSEKGRGSSDLPRSRSPESQGSTAPSVSTRALLDRVQAQQRRIAALEAADKGNDHLVSEYEKALAEITSLKGQVLKLESTLLESQIRIPMKHNQEHEKELEYLKSYCEMLKEENVQLNLKVNSLETVPTTAHHQRINDLEQTVLTLRGLVSKLQSEQKSTGIKRPDSRPSSGRSAPDKNRTQLESYRLEIANLKRSIQDKDLLLERSKEMLKIAAEREDDLLRENASLRRQLGEFEKQRYGFLSA